ncbi:PSD1 and planctomycete cytochrome C domain-containing protein [Arundinibacter roseus]|uniref:DUF1553 domain-containing protein n=1 Tax=Arundinibacter roseus TaxID=2070510 RepID=A0A4R4KJV9_9BACT|nr:PSD1 and planctomycete cytochrome C domain-containing protein [Arundinibacter roseus]TDB66909.1 DUF1553 domain-containing protein [Arundinibacter roseus]
MKKRIFLAVAFTATLALAIVSCYKSDKLFQKSNEPETVSYNFHIRPILSDKCFACHGPDAKKREANLRLDLAETAFLPLKETKGAFALVPGKPEESELYRRITSSDPAYQMPTPESHLGMLSEEEIGLVKKWIKQGAKYEKHWAFVAPVKAKLPELDEEAWPKNEIDHFVLARMEAKGLAPNDVASKEHLLKRVSLDLTGLVPSLDLMDRFLADDSNNAFEKVVDELLKQKAYGEKMAVHWLDVARYSDSYGYQDDNVRTQWPWRDWLIHSFNKNMPYDQFVTWQIAGDLLPNADKEKILATGFYRNHKYTEEGGVIPEEYRIEYVLDKTKTYSKGILAMTAECAQCHDHKYDPISQADYFSLFAFFNNLNEVGYEGDVSQSKPAKNPILQITDQDAKQLLTFINRQDTSALYVSVLGERDTLRKTYILDRGVYDAPTTEVQARPLKAVMPFDAKRYPRNRLGLAKWTTDRKNPLTARVFVNQMWQQFFGRGLVKTTGDFGMQGDLPSHPELLDWLAVDFMEHNWDIKRLIKQIVTSATYRQSARIDPKKLAVDPENIYLARGPRYRIPAEFVRDVVLSSSGLLNPEIGGPSVKPYQPEGLWEAATSGRGELRVYNQDKGKALYRRGMYTFIKLTVPPPSMIIFDGSNRDQCEVVRSKTNTPLQALVMMNDPTVLEASRVLAQNLMKEKTSADAKITKAFRRIVCRTPTAKEMKVLQGYFQEQAQLFKQKKLDPTKILNAGEYPQATISDKASWAALMQVITTIYNMEEAITKT